MNTGSKVKRAPDNEPGSWIYEVIASTVEGVQERVAQIESGRNTASALFCPIVELGDEYRARGYVVTRLYDAQIWSASRDECHARSSG